MPPGPSAPASVASASFAAPGPGRLSAGRGGFFRPVPRRLMAKTLNLCALRRLSERGARRRGPPARLRGGAAHRREAQHRGRRPRRARDASSAARADAPASAEGRAAETEAGGAASESGASDSAPAVRPFAPASFEGAPFASGAAGSSRAFSGFFPSFASESSPDGGFAPESSKARESSKPPPAASARFDASRARLAAAFRRAWAAARTDGLTGISARAAAYASSTVEGLRGGTTPEDAPSDAFALGESFPPPLSRPSHPSPLRANPPRSREAPPRFWGALKYARPPRRNPNPRPFFDGPPPPVVPRPLSSSTPRRLPYGP